MAAPRRRMKFLIVDDHTLVRDGMARVLTDLAPGAAIFEAAESHVAFAIVERESDLDLVLLDLALPGMNGLSALRSLRLEHPAIAVVIVSASVDRDIVRQALDLGAMGYIPPPPAPSPVAAPPARPDVRDAMTRPRGRRWPPEPRTAGPRPARRSGQRSADATCRQSTPGAPACNRTSVRDFGPVDRLLPGLRWDRVRPGRRRHFQSRRKRRRPRLHHSPKEN